MEKMPRNLYEFCKAALGTLLLSLAINLFYKPAAIFAGGVPGLAIILLNFLGNQFWDYLGLIILVISSLFWGIQWYFLGKRKVARATAASLMLVILVQFTTPITQGIIVSQNIILMAVGGSLLAGLGISLVITAGYSFVGTLGLAEILSRKWEMPPGKTLFIVESAQILLGTVVIGLEKALVSVIALYILSRTIQAVTFGMYQFKKLLIISPQLEPIRRELTAEISEDSSVLMAENAARHERQPVLMVIIRYDQFKRTREIIRRFDPHAFVIASDVTELIGEGFKTL